MKTINKITIILVSWLCLGFAVHADINVVSWGGAYMKAQEKALGETFKGGKVNFIEYYGGLKEISKQVKSGNVTWDVVDVLPSQAFFGCKQGLFVDLTPYLAKFTKSASGKTILEDAKENGVSQISKCVVPNIFWSYITFYDASKMKGNEPRTIKDFFDVKKFPGKRGLHTWPMATLEMALVADGVKSTDVYKVLSTKEGVDRAFKKLNTLKGNVVFWSAGSKPLKYVSSGKIVMSTAYNGRVSAAMLDEGTPFKIIWDAQVMETEWFAIVKGSPNEKEALDFLIHATAPQQMANQAKYIAYSPIRASTMEIIKKGEPWFHTGVSVAPYLATSPENRKTAIIANIHFWFKNWGPLSKRFGAFMKENGWKKDKKKK